jgi:hypothetical protein
VLACFGGLAVLWRVLPRANSRPPSATHVENAVVRPS